MPLRFFANSNIEMQNSLPNTQFRVKGDRRFITVVSLHKNHMGASRCRNSPQFFDKPRCNTFASMLYRYGEIVDVVLAALLFELGQFVGSKAADHSLAVNCHKRDE